MPDDMANAVDKWGADQKPPLGRSEAIRDLIKRGLKGNPLRDAPLVGGVSSGPAKPLKRKR
jgi:metal-responsive CopG/Arc/MetJ family transcriptional regulator